MLLTQTRGSGGHQLPVIPPFRFTNTGKFLSHPLAFDPHMFANRKAMPVKAWTEGADAEIHSTGLGFDDFSRSHIETHCAPLAFRSGAPTWVYSNAQFRLVVCRIMEKRALIRHPAVHLPPRERLAIAEQRWKDRVRPFHVALLKRLVNEELALRKSGKDPERQKQLLQQCIILDSQLLIENWPATLAAVLYLYFRNGNDSVAVANQTGITPVSVRAICSRANRTARELFEGATPPRRRRRSRRSGSGDVEGIGFRLGSARTADGGQ